MSVESKAGRVTGNGSAAGSWVARARDFGPVRLPAVAVGAQALGALAFGAVAVGAFALGAFAIGRLVVGRAKIRRLEIDELVVDRLRVTSSAELPESKSRRRLSGRPK